MIRFHFFACVAFSALIALLPSDGHSQDAKDVGRVRNHLINDVDQSAVALYPATPYIERSTILLGDFDLTKIDFPAIAQWMRNNKVGPENANVDMIKGFQQSMIGAGAKHVMVTAATRSPIDGGPVVIIPCENQDFIHGLLSGLVKNAPPRPGIKVQKGKQTVIAGAASAIDRVTQREGAHRPDLVLPIKRGEWLDHTVVFSMPDESRNDLRALWPERLPGGSPIQVSPRQLMDDVNRVIVSLRLPPNPSMVLHVETRNEGAAARIKSMLEQLRKLGGDLGSSLSISVDGTTVKASASPEAFVAVGRQAAAPARAAASDSSKLNSLKFVGLAIHNYFANEKHLPPRYYTDREGNPLLSGRVALLPYLEQQALFGALDMTKAWNSNENQQVSSTRIPLYCDQPDQGAKTTIRFPVFPGSVWHGEGPPKTFRDVRDGTSNTIAVIDAPANAAIEWANPESWVISEDDPMSDVFGDRDKAAVVFLDGAAKVIHKNEMTNQKLKALLTIAGGERVE